MMKTKKIVSLVLVAAMAASLSFTGCAKTNSSSGGATNATNNKKVTLTMIEALANPTRTKALKKIITDFEKANPNYKVNLISPPGSTADQKISQMLLAKSDLDIVEVRYMTTQQFIKNGWIAPIDDYIKNWSDYSTLTESAKADITVNNKKWGLPIGSYQRMIYYRSDWLKDAGLSIPTGSAWTYDALYDLAKKMTNPSKGRYGWALRGTGGAYQQFIEMVTLSALGKDKLLSTYEEDFTKDKKSIWRSDAAKKGLQTEYNFYKNCSPADSIAWKFDDQINAFTSGISCFLMQDCDCIGTFKKDMKDGTWATAPMPVDSVTKQGNLFLGEDFWGMTSYSKNKDATWKFLSYLGSAEPSSYFCAQYGVLPPHSNASKLQSTFNSDIYKPYSYMFSKPETYFPCGDAIQPYLSHQDEFSQLSDADIQNYLAGKVSVDSVLSKWAGIWEGWRSGAGLK